MIEEYKDIEILIERFFDGLTSNEEEKKLYTFFSGENIPGHLIKYKPVFSYFESGIVEDVINEDRKRIKPPAPKSIRNKFIFMGSGIAACLLLAFSIYFGFLRDTRNYDPYEGSYIVQNGVRITDMDLIREDLQRVEREAIERKAKADLLFNEASDKAGRYDDVEQEIIERHYQFLRDIPDKKVQSKLKEMIQQ